MNPWMNTLFQNLNVFVDAEWNIDDERWVSCLKYWAIYIVVYKILKTISLAELEQHSII